MGILYLISVAILLMAFILIRKTEKEINIVSFITISIVAIFCYNAFICYILTFFTIPIKLWLLSLINILISFGFAIPLLKKKQIQKYVFNKIDVLYIILTAIVVLIIAYINFGNPFNVKYETSDPAVHYLTSVKFAESDALLTAVEKDEVYGEFKTRKFASYVNSGLLMKCICPGLEPMDCYNVFVIFGLLILFFTGVTLYAAFTNFAKKKEHRLWAFIISLICMLGYPLNSFLFGFEYMSMGLLIICAILDLVKYYDDEIINIKYFIVLMSLLNFGLFSAYFMFVPFVYPALWIYFYIKNYQKTKKIINKNVLILWTVTLIIPFILGYIYHLEPRVYRLFINNPLKLSGYSVLAIVLYFILSICFCVKKYQESKKIIPIKFIIIPIVILLTALILVNILNMNKNGLGGYSTSIINSQFDMDGYIYINLYSNMLLLLPLTIYLIIREKRNKSFSNVYFISLLLLFTSVFLLILYKGYESDLVSIYYLSKNYFALWIILLYCNYKALLLLSEKHRYLPKIFIGIYVFLMIFCTAFSNVKMVDDTLKNEDENILSVMEIFGSNKTMLIEEDEKLNQDEIKILMYARENLDYNSKIEVVSEGIQYYWSYVLLRYVNYEPVLDRVGYGQYKLNLKVYYLGNKINNVDYMIYFNRSQKYNQLKHRLFINSEIIYENEAGGILKYNK